MTARIVAVGHVKPEHGTLTVRFATGEPMWSPLVPDEPDEFDADLYRKQQIEDELAWGNDI